MFKSVLKLNARLAARNGIAIIIVAATSGFAIAKARDSTHIKIGIIGLDTSHSVAFTEVLNSNAPPPAIDGCRVVAAYPYGSRDIESSVSRIPEYTDQVRKLGVEIVDSIDTLLERVDAVLLETNDGRLHFEQAMLVLKAHKPIFIDKPIAASLTDTIAIFAAAEHYGVPIFSSSCLRFSAPTLAVRNGGIGNVLGCDTFCPCSLESTHPDLFWYGIHGVEALFTAMKPGCTHVRRVQMPNVEFVIGEWSDGRIGTFRGMRNGTRDFGGIAFGTTGNQIVGQNPGYEPLLFEIVRFFRGGVAPVTADETIEIIAFMQAADESKRRNGAPVSLESVLEAARKEAEKKQTW